MRSHPGSYRLTFLLPNRDVTVECGTFQPSPEGCRLTVRFPMVEILGPSRESVFDHAARLLRVACRGQRPLSMAGRLQVSEQPIGGDAWTIIVGADVAFSPTGLGAEFPRQQHAPPALELVRAS